MSRANDDSSMVFIAVTLLVLLAIGIWVHQQITAFASLMGLDFDAAFGLLRNIAILAVVLVSAAVMGLFRYVAAYIPAALLMVMVPALKFWSAGHLMPEFSEFSPPGELLWYGRTWVQAVAIIGLTAGGYYWQERS